LHSQAPVSPVTLPTGDQAWLVTGHQEVLVVLSDDRFSRHALTLDQAPRLAPIPPFPSLFYLDPPDLDRIRALAGRAFGRARTQQLREPVRNLVETYLDDLTDSPEPGDLMATLARPLPLAVLTVALGVPIDRRTEFVGLVRSATAFGADPQQQMAALQNLQQLVLQLAVERRKHPAPDMMSDIVAPSGADRLADPEVFALVMDLIGAGDQPVTAEITHLFLNLLRDPARWGALTSRPELVPTAVEELLRHSQSAGGGLGSIRIAVTDINLGGVLIRAGDAVIPSLNAANLDPRVFDEPNRIDLSRQPNPHLTFGQGLHHCLGAALGRLELTELVAALVRRLPGLRLGCEEDQLEWMPVPVFSTPLLLPVRWT